MVKVSLKKSGNTNVFYKKKSQVSYKQYTLDDRVNRASLLKVLDSFKNRLQDGHIYKFAGFFNTTGYRDGVFFTKANFDKLRNDIIYNFEAEYENADTEQTCKTFVIYDAKIPNAKGGIDDLQNDCLFTSIIRGLNYNYDLLPTEINSGKKLKEYLKLNRNAKVPLEKVKDIISLLAEKEISIQIIGDHRLETEEQQININIELHNEHYELKLENMTYIEQLRDQMLKGVDKSKYNRQVYSYFEEKETNKIFTYNGSIVEEFDYTPKIRNTLLFNIKSFMVKAESNDINVMKDKRDYILNQSQLLLSKTKGKINLLKYRNVKCCALDYFIDCYQKLNIEVESIDELEARWLYEFYHFGGGGFVFHEEYEGDFITIDECSAYPSTYISTMFTPIKKPTFRTLKESDLKTYQVNGKECKSFTYGMYRCKVSYDETKKKLFKWKFKHDKYSHMDLKRAQELGLTVKLIEDGEVNAMQYSTESLFKSDTLLGETIRSLTKLKQDGLTIAKELVNSLSGAMSQINKKQKVATIKVKQNVDDFDKMIPGRSIDNVIIMSINTDKIFKYPFARQTIFCINKWKNRLSELCEPVIDNIIRICTDSITLKNYNEELVKKTFKIGKNLKEFKIEMDGRCKIENNCIKYWSKDANKYLNKKELKNYLTKSK